MKERKRARKGVLAGGNWIVDRVKRIDFYPERETLATIESESRGTGGSPYNVLIDLSLLGAPFPLSAAGLVGADELGRDILRDCRRHRINIKQLAVAEEGATSYTDVMSEPEEGVRTFFHFRGANAEWTGETLDFAKTSARHFHLGYLLLLDALDSPCETHGTLAASLLARAQEAGLATSIDAVSEDSDRFAEIIPPALAHTDYCFLNEIEAGRTTGFEIRDEEGELDRVALRHAAGKLLESGIGKMVVIHFAEGAFARTKEGEDHWQSSLELPPDFIEGAAGAGDAFCAGVLYGIHESWTIPRSLLAGVAAAAASLSHPTCTGGLRTMDECLALAEEHPPL